MSDVANRLYGTSRIQDLALFYLFAGHFVSCTITWRIMTSLDYIYSAQKRKRRNTDGEVSGWTRRACVKKFTVYLLKTSWTFPRKTMVCCVDICNYLVLFSVESRFVIYTSGAQIRAQHGRGIISVGILMLW